MYRPAFLRGRKTFIRGTAFSHGVRICRKEEQKMAQVTKSTMIGELLQIDENIAPVLLNIGMHCLGCPSSQMETIEEAAMVHGIEPDALVAQINDFLAKDLA
jgi:hybrid cluster-associated redox disulfide protein